MKKYDLLILGGGFAGASAAICAARRGVKTLIVDKSGALGGAATNCLVFPFMSNKTRVNGEIKELSQGIFDEIKDSLYELYPKVDNKGAFHD